MTSCRTIHIDVPRVKAAVPVRHGRSWGWVGWAPPFSGTLDKGGDPVEDNSRGLAEVVSP